MWNTKFSKTIDVDWKTNFDELIYRKTTKYIGADDLFKIEVSPVYLFDFEREKHRKIDQNGEDVFDHSAGSAFLNGKHYLVDARGKTMTISEKEPKLTTVTEAQNFERTGYFIFHYGSSIGTHFIETQNMLILRFISSSL